MIKICYFGTYSKDVTRTKILIDGLETNYIKVEECKENLPEIHIIVKNKITFVTYHFLFSLSLFIKYIKLAVKFFSKTKNCKTIIVGYPFRYDAILAYCLCLVSGKKLVVDYFMSLYETHIIDRNEAQKHSFKAIKLFLTDFLTVLFADKLIIDTIEHGKYFQTLFPINNNKLILTFVGADNKIIIPLTSPSSKKFNVFFHGNFIPLQGAEYIIKAAYLLKKNKKIVFNLIGEGQTYKKTRNLAGELGCHNVNFLGNIPFNELSNHLKKANVCLGIFGSTVKTTTVVPNKAYEIMAIKKPLITSNTPAIKEVFTHKKDCFLCERANEKSLADAILYLKNNSKLKKSIAKEGYNLFKNKYTPDKVVERLIKYINVINNS